MSCKNGLIYTIAICLVSNFYCTAKEDHNAYQDSLFQEKFYSQGAFEDANRIINKMPNNLECNELLLKFIEKCPNYRDYALKKLTLNNYSKLPTYLTKNKDNLFYEDWKVITEALETKKGLQVDSSLNKILHEVSSTSPNDDIRGRIRYYFARYGKFSDVKIISNHFKNEASSKNRWSILKSLSRYKHAKTDSLLINYLNTAVNFDEIDFFLVFGIQDYNRYDLLPEVSNLKNRMSLINEISILERVNKTIQKIDTTIKILEQKKAENAPIGLPLNWPDEPVKK